MRSYRVKWNINIDADTPEEAARKAQDYQRDPEAIVGVFEVGEVGGRAIHWKTIDLDAIDGRIEVIK